AAMKREQKTGARETPLGKDAHDLAARQGITGHAQRLNDGPWSGPLVDGNHPGPLQQMSQTEFLGPAREDDKMDETPLPGQEEQPVEMADMVANQKRRPRGRDVFFADHV